MEEFWSGENLQVWQLENHSLSFACQMLSNLIVCSSFTNDWPSGGSFSPLSNVYPPNFPIQGICEHQ